MIMCAELQERQFSYLHFHTLSTVFFVTNNVSENKVVDSSVLPLSSVYIALPPITRLNIASSKNHQLHHRQVAYSHVPRPNEGPRAQS